MVLNLIVVEFECEVVELKMEFECMKVVVNVVMVNVDME